jgi:hypothetical protein
MKNEKTKFSFYNQVVTDKSGREYKIKFPATSQEDFGRMLNTETELLFSGTFFKTRDLREKVLQNPVLFLKFSDCYRLERI